MPDTVLEQAPWRATRKSSAESTKRRNHEQLELSSTSNEKTNCQGVQEDGGEEGDEEETKGGGGGGGGERTTSMRSTMERRGKQRDSANPKQHARRSDEKTPAHKHCLGIKAGKQHI
ncbi:unnamed protein product [Prorocentrum cordatum]|uniref:Uncharacterized protein n=1 Tax=Prorocentrum cordatum TaxID=2364126 RepID=A0ABN9XE74_9DINO|nr:unnamed protein product [Polarella glacialis]